MSSAMFARCSDDVIYVIMYVGIIMIALKEVGIWYDLCFFRPFRTNNLKGDRTVSRTNLSKNGFFDALIGR